MTSHRQKWLLLTVLALAQFMVILDTSIVNVALASIQHSLDLNVRSLQLIVTMYTLTFGGFMLLGGRAADLWGRRRVFIWGTVAFASVSLCVGLSGADWQIVALRGAQGLAAAFMSPSALSIILATFREARERAFALSVWGAVGAGGAASGVLLGGILTQYFGWQWDFFVNVPVGVLVAFGAWQLVPAHMAQERVHSLDLPGAFLVTGGLMVIVYALSEASVWGWASAAMVFSLAAGSALLAAFIWNEARARHPLMPLSFFRIGNVLGADLVQMPVTASLFSMFFFLSLYLQNILGFSPLQTGLGFLPIPLTVATSSLLAPRVIRRVGYKPVIVTATLFLSVGLFTLSHLTANSSYLYNVLPPALLMAIGLGSSFVAISIAATEGVPGHESGLASGLLNTAQRLGGSVGLAVLAAVSSAATAIPSAGAVAGFHYAFLTGMCFALLACVLAVTLIRAPRSH